jgi:hypothetical protein
MNPRFLMKLHRFKVDMTQFPNIEKIVQKLQSHDAFVRSHPSQQIDAVL